MHTGKDAIRCVRGGDKWLCLPDCPLQSGRALIAYARSLSGQSKLIGAFVLLTLIAIGAMSRIGYDSASTRLRATSMHELRGWSL